MLQFGIEYGRKCFISEFNRGVLVYVLFVIVLGVTAELLRRSTWNRIASFRTDSNNINIYFFLIYFVYILVFFFFFLIHSFLYALLFKKIYNCTSSQPTNPRSS